MSNWLTCYTSLLTLNESAVVVKALHACCSVVCVATFITTAFGEKIPILLTLILQRKFKVSSEQWRGLIIKVMVVASLNNVKKHQKLMFLKYNCRPCEHSTLTSDHPHKCRESNQDGWCNISVLLLCIRNGCTDQSWPNLLVSQHFHQHPSSHRALL